MRGAFIHLLSARYGPRSISGPPGVTYVSGVPCRRVVQTRIDNFQFDFSLSAAWVTVDALSFNNPEVVSYELGEFTTDQLAADEVMFDHLPGRWFSVCREERVFPRAGLAYWRYFLVETTDIVVPPWLPPSPRPPWPVPLASTACVTAPTLAVGQPVAGSWSGVDQWLRLDVPAAGHYEVFGTSSSGTCAVDMFFAPCGLGALFTLFFIDPSGTNYFDTVGPGVFNLRVYDTVAPSCDWAFWIVGP